MFSSGELAKAFAPQILLFVAIIFALGAAFALGIFWGIPWLWHHVSIAIH